MSEGERRKLEHRLAQARRLAALPVEDLTKERIAGLFPPVASSSADVNQSMGAGSEPRQIAPNGMSIGWDGEGVTVGRR